MPKHVAVLIIVINYILLSTFVGLWIISKNVHVMSDNKKVLSVTHISLLGRFHPFTGHEGH